MASDQPMTERSAEERFVEAMRGLRAATQGTDVIAHVHGFVYSGPNYFEAICHAFADAVCGGWAHFGGPLDRPHATCRANLLKRVMGGER